MKLKQRTIYYQDELHDEFAGDHIKAKHIGQDYRYIRVRLLERMLHGFWYRIVAVPLARLYMKLHFSHKIINKEVLKQAGNSGFYLYGNHTTACPCAIFFCRIFRASFLSIPCLRPPLFLPATFSSMICSRCRMSLVAIKNRSGCGISFQCSKKYAA